MHFVSVFLYLLAIPLTASRRALAPPHPLRTSKHLPLDPYPKEPNRHLRSLTSSGRVHNLVIPIRFADHADRELPPPSDLGVVFNSIEGAEQRQTLAPTGSVRDVFLFNSYGKLEMVSTVLPWVNLTKTELDASGGSYGMSAALLEALYEALALADVSSFDINEFDSDSDGIIDIITFLHSGYMAEWGGVDCYGRDEPFRLWSHKWQIPPNLQLNDRSIFPLEMDSYVIASAVWGKCGSTIARVGLLSHELCHFLGPGSNGLEDLYDTSPGQEGRGLGSYDLLSDTWGRDYTQLYPPMMSPWTKAYLGWLEPIIITSNGNYTLPASATVPSAYRIDAGFQEGEYLLIENRQAVGFDSLISAGGLAVYMVDEKAPWQERRGFPTQPGWPRNGNHYSIALLQADGAYDLERGRNTGDAGDLWHAHSERTFLGPGYDSKEVNATTYPNSDSYQSGIITSTGIVISDFSESGEIMSFSVFSPFLEKPFVRNEAIPRSEYVLEEVEEDWTTNVTDDEEQKSTMDASLNDAFHDSTVTPSDNDSSGASIRTLFSYAFVLVAVLFFHNE